MKTLCAIPCLNEEVAVASVVLRALPHVDEVLVVDDGSTDATAKVAAAAGAHVIRHEKNRGKGAAYQTLWSHAREHGFDRLVVLDGDGQHNADEIPLLLAELAAGNDVVVGKRWGDRTEMPRWRRAGKRILDYGTMAASGAGKGPRLTDSQSGFRAYSDKTLRTIVPIDAGFSVESQLLVDAHKRDLRIGETRIHCRYDVEGSTLGPVRHATGVLNELLIHIGIRHPLLLLALPGTIALLLGSAAGAWGVYIYSEGIFAPGWALLSILLVLLGALGVLVGMLFHLLPRSVARALHNNGQGAWRRRP